MIRRNSSWFTSPSPSLSASSIISLRRTVSKEVKVSWGQSRRPSSIYSSPYLQLLVCEVLSQLFGYSFQVLEGDFARLIVIK